MSICQGYQLDLAQVFQWMLVIQERAASIVGVVMVVLCEHVPNKGFCKGQKVSLIFGLLDNFILSLLAVLVGVATGRAQTVHARTGEA